MFRCSCWIQAWSGTDTAEILALTTDAFRHDRHDWQINLAPTHTELQLLSGRRPHPVDQCFPCFDVLAVDGEHQIARLQSGARTLSIQGQTVLLACTDAGEMSEEISSVAHKLRDLLDPDALFLVINTVEGMRLVGRSTTDKINVAKIAAKFGGGGHERAAAALVKMPYPFPVPEGGDALEAACQEVERLLVQTIQPSVTVGQIMSHRPRVLDPQTSAQEAGALMQRYGYEGYPVLDEGKVVGLLTRRAVDRALAMGRIDATMPWAKAKVVEALAAPYSTREEAQRKIEAFLRAEYPDDKAVGYSSAQIRGAITVKKAL